MIHIKFHIYHHHHHLLTNTNEVVINYIHTLPLVATPEIFGLHVNAEITKNKKDSAQLLKELLITEDSSAENIADDLHQVLLNITNDILNKLTRKKIFDIEQISVKYPVKYSESMNTVLVQECIRYNHLISIIQSSCIELQKALEGLIVMNESLETLASNLYNNQLPLIWLKASYPSLKAVGSYILDLMKRIQFLKDWILHGQPIVSWLSGIFFTHSFLTGTLQNYARKYQIPIDTITFDFDFLIEQDSTKVIQLPTNGVYIHGLYLEAASWDYQHKQLIDSIDKILYTKAPIIWFIPKVKQEIQLKHVYICPLYRTSERRGTLSTTGHSTNFVMSIHLPIDSNINPQFYILRSVALLTQLDD